MPGKSEKFAVIIPARYASSRYPGKPLAALRGATGLSKPLIQRTWETACAIQGHGGIWVATDSEMIADTVKNFGGEVVMTSPDCRNGTERCADAMSKIDFDGDIIVNLQGDAPMTPPEFVPELVQSLIDSPSAAMATPAIRCSASLYGHMVQEQAEGRIGGTTVTFDRNDRALYFSKRLIPYRSDNLSDPHEGVHLHLGVYAYRVRALAAYALSDPTPLEHMEGLEQLRFLEEGETVRVKIFGSAPWECIELNNPHDMAPLEAALHFRNIA